MCAQVISALDRPDRGDTFVPYRDRYRRGGPPESVMTRTRQVSVMTNQWWLRLDRYLVCQSHH
jgi:hypothetical protein